MSAEGEIRLDVADHVLTTFEPQEAEASEDDLIAMLEQELDG